MNRAQGERVEGLGIAFQRAINEIIELGEDRPMTARVEEGGEVMEDIPEPAIHLNSAPHEVSLRQVNNGFVVSVGCQTFVFEKFETASKYMAMYFENPDEITAKHYANTLFK